MMSSSSSSSSVAILKIHNPPPRIVQAPCRSKECGAVRVCMCEMLLGLQKLRCGGASFQSAWIRVWRTFEESMEQEEERLWIDARRWRVEEEEKTDEVQVGLRNLC